jgi:hypothetical protein
MMRHVQGHVQLPPDHQQAHLPEGRLTAWRVPPDQNPAHPCCTPEPQTQHVPAAAAPPPQLPRRRLPPLQPLPLALRHRRGCCHAAGRHWRRLQRHAAQQSPDAGRQAWALRVPAATAAPLRARCCLPALPPVPHPPPAARERHRRFRQTGPQKSPLLAGARDTLWCLPGSGRRS